MIPIQKGGRVMKDFFNTANQNPIIAALNHVDKLDKVIQSPCKIVFLLTGNILNLGFIVDSLKKKDKLVYIHIDLIDGFSKDDIAVKFIYEHIGLDGIITTKANLIKAAKELHIFTIQRLFILDSLALDSGINSIKNTKPNAVEILPGIMPKIVKNVIAETRIPVITGGLIKEKEDVILSLKAGAIAISTSNEEVWYM